MVELASQILSDPVIDARLRLIAAVRIALADALWWLGSPSAAMGALSELDTDLVSPAVARRVWVRRHLLGRMEPGDELLLDYATGRPGSEASMPMLLSMAESRPNDPLSKYLLAFRYQQRGLHSDAADLFSQVGSPFGLAPVLIREAAYRSGKLRSSMSRYEEARTSLALAAQFEDIPGYQLAIQRWQRFILFQQAKESKGSTLR